MLRLALLLALGGFATSLGLQKIRTFDYWWHLRTGALIAETGAVPRVDPYTYTVEGSRWIDIHWLHQLALHGLYELGGHEGVVIAKALLVLALVTLLATIGWRRERPVVTVFALGLMLASAGDRFMPRPELPSFVLLAAVLALLDRHGRRGDAWVFGVVPLQVLWVNVHGLFALGLAVCAIYLVAEVLRPLILPGESQRREAIIRVAAVTGLSLAASLLNPNGLEGLLYPVEQLGMIGPPDERGFFGSVIAELIPPLGGIRDASVPLLVLTGALGLLSATAMVANWRHVHAADPLLWVAFAYLALSANRNVALFGIVAAPLLVRNLNEVLDRHPPRRALLVGASLLVGGSLVGATFDVASNRYFKRLGALRETGLSSFDAFYPVGALDWIAQVRPAGPIFHHMADGGYVLWRLFPDYRGMIDGRLEVFGPERFVELSAQAPERFRELDDQYAFGVALIHFSLVESSGLLWWLHVNPNWGLGYVDDAAAVYFRRDRNEAWLRSRNVDAPDLFPPFSERAGPTDLVRRMGRTNFYMAMRRPKQALEIWEETLDRYQDLAQGAIVRATLLHRAGFAAAAEAVLRQLLDERPDDPKLLCQIGDLRLEAGDRDAARELYDQAIVADHTFAYASLRRGLLAEEEGDPGGAVLFYTRVVASSHPANPMAALAASRIQALAGGP
jgi:tetratricopeptide (TPR) repeat protein